MRIEILSDKPVSSNLAAGDTSVACAYPVSTLLADDTIVCIYRQGATKHSHDGIFMMQTSADEGNSWGEPKVIFDGRQLQPPQTAIMAGVCQTRANTFLFTFGVIEGLEAGVYMFDEEARTLPTRMYVRRSGDGGRTWSTLALLNTSGLIKAGPTTKPFVLPDGVICVPMEHKTELGPNGTAVTFSKDDGRTFEPPIPCPADPAGQLNLCDAHFAVLPDGRILMLLWTFLQENEETIEVHRSFSSDGGRTWTKPEGIGFVGQVTVPLALPTGEVIAVSNYRHPPEGIRLWLSPDGGVNWDVEHPLQMWDAGTACMVGEPIEPHRAQTSNEGVWDALARFSFGTPDLLYLTNGSILMVYYATLAGVIHVRACRFRLSLD